MRQTRRPWRPASLLEIHQAHYRNFGAYLPLGEEDDPDEVDRILAWRAAPREERHDG